eukprot:scaffold91446_cov48-Phaeocystis_antarctica.AAC.3
MIYAVTLAMGFLAGGQLPGSSVMRGSSAVMQATEVCDANTNCGHPRTPRACSAAGAGIPTWLLPSCAGEARDHEVRRAHGRGGHAHAGRRLLARPCLQVGRRQPRRLRPRQG